MENCMESPGTSIGKRSLILDDMFLDYPPLTA
jgi:hypothetical protein